MRIKKMLWEAEGNRDIRSVYIQPTNNHLTPKKENIIPISSLRKKKQLSIFPLCICRYLLPRLSKIYKIYNLKKGEINQRNKTKEKTGCLDGRFVGNWVHGLWVVVLHADSPRFPGHGWQPLEMNGLTLLLGGPSPGGVILDAADELFPAL